MAERESHQFWKWLNMTDCIVVGAGMVGVGTALALQERGWSVLLVDRSGPGTETSYGNAGIIQTEAVSPYALPRAPLELLRAAFGANNQIAWRLRDMPRQVGPLWRYWHNSEAGRHRTASQFYARMIRRAADDHAPLIEAAGAENLIRRAGLRELHRSARSFDLSARDAELKRQEFGVASIIEDGKAVSAAEPSLKANLAGAIHWTDPWSCSDPGALVQSYASLFVKRGGTFVQGDARGLRQDGSGWQIDTADGPHAARHVVLALGPWSPEILRTFGYKIPLVIKRGYHQHFSGAGPKVPVLDVSNSTVATPMRAGLRILTGAELTPLGSVARHEQLNRSIKAISELFDIGAPVEHTPWFGSRPCMPRMLPVVGEAPRHKGLWLNFGHGHQGFTLGPTTGRILAERMTGEPEDAKLYSALALRH